MRLSHAALGAVLFVLPVHAEEALPNGCRPSFMELAKDLSEKWGETLRFVGRSEKSGLGEGIFARDGGSWTRVQVLPEGMACMVDGGAVWRAPIPGEPT